VLGDHHKFCTLRIIRDLRNPEVQELIGMIQREFGCHSAGSRQRRLRVDIFRMPTSAEYLTANWRCRPKPVNACIELIATKRPLPACGTLIPTSPLRGAAMREEDFYPKPRDHWERANDNLAGWLGLQHLTTLDVFILLPLIPLIALPIVLSFPWEVLAREDAQKNRRRLPAVLRIHVVALSCALQVRPWLTKPRTAAAPRVRESYWESISKTHQGQRRKPQQKSECTGAI
jgi:hypothetical protein